MKLKAAPLLLAAVSLVVLASMPNLQAEPRKRTTRTVHGTVNTGTGRAYIYSYGGSAVNTGGTQMGVQVQNGRVLLVNNGGRFLKENVHVANVAKLGEKRTTSSPLVSRVPTPKSVDEIERNLLPVSGDKWYEKAKAKKKTSEDSASLTVAKAENTKATSATTKKEPTNRVAFFSKLRK